MSGFQSAVAKLSSSKELFSDFACPLPSWVITLSSVLILPHPCFPHLYSDNNVVITIQDNTCGVYSDAYGK